MGPRGKQLESAIPCWQVRGPHKLHSFSWAGGRTTSADEGTQAKSARILIADRANCLRMYR